MSEPVSPLAPPSHAIGGCRTAAPAQRRGWSQLFAVGVSIYAAPALATPVSVAAPRGWK
jgi:hypothetical protein